MFLQTSKNISVHTATKRFAHTEKLRSAKFGLNNNVKTVANYQRIFAVVKTITRYVSHKQIHSWYSRTECVRVQ